MNWLRKTYDWVLHWSATQYAIPALLIISFTESSFFPIPPDVLLIAMTVSVPKRAFYFAAICSLASVSGGVFGYYLGFEFMDFIGNKIIGFYGLEDRFEKIAQLYNDNGGWAVAAAGFTPLPYKVFALAAGAFKIDMWTFLIASAISRSARFFLVAGLIWKFGPPIKLLIEKYFNIISFVFFVLLFVGFLLIKLVV